ncbi:MAG: tetratricopeptide repeat protein, partial [Nitrospinota bacterium]
VYILENTLVKQGLTIDGILQALLSTYASNWHPLTWVSHMLDFELFGLNGQAFHGVNALFHAANAMLLYLVLNSATKAPWRSLFIAAIFSVHPLHVESVAWISERKDLLSTFFMLFTIFLYLKYCKTRSWKYYLFALVLFFLAVLSKPTVVTLPCLLLLLDFWPLKRVSFEHFTTRQGTAKDHDTTLPPLKLFQEKIPFFAVTALSSFMTYHAQKQGFAVVPVEGFSISSRIINALISYMEYLENFLFPFNLAVLYPLRESSINSAIGIASGAFLLFFSMAAVKTAEKAPWVLVGWLWFLGALFPMIGIVQVGFQSRADRYTYIPLIGLSIIVVWLLTDFFLSRGVKRSTLSGFGGLIVLLFATLTFFQIQVWKNSIALFENTLRNTSRNYLIHTYLGAELERTGSPKRAIEEYEKAISINPDFPLPYNNLGMVFEKAGEPERAIAYFEKAIELNPSLEKPYFNLGNVWYKLGELDKAEDHQKTALRINPNFAAAQNAVGYILFLKKKYKEAANHLKRALHLAPDFYMAHNNLGIVYAVEGNEPAAIYHFKEAIKLDPENPAATENLKKLIR